MHGHLLSGTGMRSGADNEILEFEAGISLGVHRGVGRCSARRLFGT
jgi:hypothetical protein